MNERQAQNFLYEWGEKRAGGIGKVLLLGAGIGAFGGVLFGVLFWAFSPNLSLNEDDLAPFLLLLARAIGPAAFLFLMAVLMFGGLGVFMAFTVWRKMEGQYHQLIDAGVRPAAEKPVYTWKDRAPKLIVIGAALLLMIWLICWTWWELNRGSM